MHNVFMLIGPPCSGKSTWTKAHFAAAERPAHVASTDDILEEYAAADGVSYSEAWTRHFKVADQEMFSRFRDAMAAGQDIIIDRTNMRAKVRRKFLSQISRKNYRIVAVIFEVPRDVLSARLISRAQETGKYIPDEVVTNMLETYQPPEPADFDEIIHVTYEQQLAA